MENILQDVKPVLGYDSVPDNKTNGTDVIIVHTLQFVAREG